MNSLKTVILLVAFTALVMAHGYTLGGLGGTTMALALAAAMNFLPPLVANTALPRSPGPVSRALRSASALAPFGRSR